MYSVGRRNVYRLGKRLHDSGSRGRQGGRGTYRAADSLVCLPRDPHWLREGIGELVTPISLKTFLSVALATVALTEPEAHAAQPIRGQVAPRGSARAPGSRAGDTSEPAGYP